MQYLSAWLITHNIKHPMNKTGSSHTYIIIGKLVGQIIKKIRKLAGTRFSASGRCRIRFNISIFSLYWSSIVSISKISNIYTLWY